MYMHTLPNIESAAISSAATRSGAVADADATNTMLNAAATMSCKASTRPCAREDTLPDRGSRSRTQHTSVTHDRIS